MDGLDFKFADVRQISSFKGSLKNYKTHNKIKNVLQSHLNTPPNIKVHKLAWTPRGSRVSEPRWRPHPLPLGVLGGPEPALPGVQPHQRAGLGAPWLGGRRPLRPPLRGHPLLQLQPGLLGLERLPPHALRLRVRLPVLALLLHPAEGEEARRLGG